MKNVLLLAVGLSLTACSSGGGGGGNASTPSVPQVIAAPNVKCGGASCMDTGASVMSMAQQKSQVSTMSTSGYPFFQLEYSYLLSIVSSMKAGMDQVNSMASSAGYATCADIPTSGSTTSGNINAVFSTSGVVVDWGSGPVTFEKKIILSSSGYNAMEIEVNCGTSTTQTVHVIYKPSMSEQYEMLYQVDTSTGYIFLQSSSIVPRSNVTAKTIAQFRTTSSSAFEMISVSQYTDSSVVSNNVQFQSAIAKSDGSDANNIEYAVAYPNPSTNGTGDTTSSLDDVNYGTGSGSERVCLVDYKSSAPTFSTNKNDCHTSSTIAVVPSEAYLPSLSGGSQWTTRFVHDLVINDIQ